MSAKASSLGSEASSAVSYLEPEVQSLTDADVEAFLDDEPALATYEQYLDDVLRKKPHTRSSEVEEVLADLSEVTDAPSEIYSMLTNADMTYGVVEDPDGEEVEITQANFTKLQTNPDREFRERVHETFYDEWADVRNTVGTSLEKAVREHVTSAEIRDYDSARAAALDGSNVPVEVYDTLVDTVDDNLDVLHRHADLKAEALGVDRLQSHDLYMSLTGDQGPDVEYEQAREWVIEAVAPLGEAGAAGRGARLALGRRVREPREALGRVLLGHVRHPAVHHDELPGRHLFDVHAGPRARPLDALGAGRRRPAVARRELRDLRRGDRLDGQRDPAHAPPARHRRGRRAPHPRPRRVPRTLPLDPLPPDHVRDVRTGDPRARGGRRRAHPRRVRRDLRRPEGRLLRARRTHRRHRARVAADSPLLLRLRPASRPRPPSSSASSTRATRPPPTTARC